MTYLQKLTSRLAGGIAQLPEEICTRHTSFLISAQNDDGGFSGREGASDLYYTGFALRSLMALGALSPQMAVKTAGFLKQCLFQSATIVDFYSLLYSSLLVQTAGGPDILEESPADWPQRVAATFETFRTKDGGYGKATNSASGSTYHTFLVGMSYELLGKEMPGPEQILQFVDSRRRDDGGFVEIAPMRRSGTNPTAAAVGIVQLIEGEQFKAENLNHVVDFLSGLVSMEGGYCANSRIPVGDLLSTFTAAWTLSQLNAEGRIDKNAALKYAQTLEQPAGGFRGGIWDECTDVEYTFYGLGTMAILQ